MKKQVKLCKYNSLTSSVILTRYKKKKKPTQYKDLMMSSGNRYCEGQADICIPGMTFLNTMGINLIPGWKWQEHPVIT